jgi:hypothetical protein
VQEREALTGQITTKPSHASDVFFRSVQATDNASFYGVGASAPPARPTVSSAWRPMRQRQDCAFGSDHSRHDHTT